MALLKKILNKLNGLHYRQEYLCFARESFTHPLHAYLVRDNQVLADITDRHCFTGYNPVIFALHSVTEAVLGLRSIDILFTNKLLEPNEVFHEKDAIAKLVCWKIHEQKTNTRNIAYYEAISGWHRLASYFHQSVTQLNNRLFNKKAGNVFLRGNLYTRVQIAYAIPRVISLVTVGDGGDFNLFPTDLHGPAGDDYYVISLRHEGKACQQVEKAKTILLSEIDVAGYKTVYGLGKNHMQEPKSKDKFPFNADYSAHLKLPLPSSAILYRELELQDLFRSGIHQVMLFRQLNKQALVASPNTLVHIHNVYATWRDNNHLEGNYLLR